MAKFFLTNSDSIEEGLYQHLLTTDFTISSRKHIGSSYSIVVQKRSRNNESVFKGKEFCIVTGTCIYKESLDYEQLLADFDANISAIRERTIGQYALCIGKHNQITIFGDSCGCYDIYYYQDNGIYLVSNSLWEMSIVLKDRLILDKEKVIERVLNRAILNGNTFFTQIKRLRGYEVIHINGTLSIERFKPCYTIWNDDQHDAIIDKVAETLRKNARISSKLLGQPVVCMTGGLDSRMILAAYLSVGVKPKLLYGVGNSSITFPKDEDEQCVDYIAAKFGLEKIKADFAIEQPINKHWDHLIHNYGYTVAYMWGGSINIINSLSHSVQDDGFLLFGWGGELYRNIDGWTEKCATDNTKLSELANNWYMKRASFYTDKVKKIFPDYNEHIFEQLKKECADLAIDFDNMNVDDSFMIEIAYRSQADTQIPSFLQQNSQVYLLLFDDNILRYRLSHRHKDNARFMLEIMYKLYPEILECPLFSHGCYQRFDAQTMAISRISPNIFEKVYRSRIFKMLTAPIPEKVVLWARAQMLNLLGNIRNSKDKSKQVDWITEVRDLKQPSYAIDITDGKNGEDIVMNAILLQALSKIGY